MSYQALKMKYEGLLTKYDLLDKKSMLEKQHAVNLWAELKLIRQNCTDTKKIYEKLLEADKIHINQLKDQIDRDRTVFTVASS